MEEGCSNLNFSIFDQNFTMTFISPVEAKKELESGMAVLLDVREPYEQTICAIGGIQIPMAEVLNQAHVLDKTRMTIVMCRSGKRAEAVANLLEKECGFEQVCVLDGGVLAWIEQIDPELEGY